MHLSYATLSLILISIPLGVLLARLLVDSGAFNLTRSTLHRPPRAPEPVWVPRPLGYVEKFPINVPSGTGPEVQPPIRTGTLVSPVTLTLPGSTPPPRVIPTPRTLDIVVPGTVRPDTDSPATPTPDTDTPTPDTDTPTTTTTTPTVRAPLPGRGRSCHRVRTRGKRQTRTRYQPPSRWRAGGEAPEDY